MVLELSITSHDRSMALEESMTAYGWCRDTGREAWSWNGLSWPRDDLGKPGQKHGLEMVYQGVWACWETGTEGSITACRTM